MVFLVPDPAAGHNGLIHRRKPSAAAALHYSKSPTSSHSLDDTNPHGYGTYEGKNAERIGDRLGGGEEGDNQGVNNAVAAAVRRRVPGLESLTMHARLDVQRYVAVKTVVKTYATHREPEGQERLLEPVPTGGKG